MFERYSEEARRAIFFARSEAIHRRAAMISTVHLLLGVAWEEDSRAAVAGSLKEKLVPICAMLGLPHRPCSDVPYSHSMDLRLDQDAKKALVFAARESDLDGRKVIDTDHLLRGLLCFPNVASKALTAASICLIDLRASCGGSSVDPQSLEIAGAGSATSMPALKTALRILAWIGMVGVLIALILHWIN